MAIRTCVSFIALQRSDAAFGGVWRWHRPSLRLCFTALLAQVQCTAKPATLTLFALGSVAARLQLLLPATSNLTPRHFTTASHLLDLLLLLRPLTTRQATHKPSLPPKKKWPIINVRAADNSHGRARRIVETAANLATAEAKIETAIETEEAAAATVRARARATGTALARRASALGRATATEIETGFGARTGTERETSPRAGTGPAGAQHLRAMTRGPAEV